MKDSIHLDILVEGGVITREVRKLTEKFVDGLEEKITLDWEAETSSMFVTHLAAAIQRMLRQETITTIADVMRAEMNVEKASYIMTEHLMKILQQESKQPLQCSEEENLLIAMYIETLTQ